MNITSPYNENIDLALTENIYNNENWNRLNMKWLPFIGKNYSNKGVLIVGLSHYEGGDNWNNCLQTTMPNIVSVYEHMRNESVKKTLKNVERIFFFGLPQNEVDKLSENFWNSISFYQFLDTPMNSEKSHNKKIEKNEIENNNAFEKLDFIISELKPNNVIFLSQNQYYQEQLVKRINNLEELPETAIYENFNSKSSIRAIKVRDNKTDNLFWFTHLRHPSRLAYKEKQNSLLRRSENQLVPNP